MKAKIISVKHYYAKTKDGELYNVNINNDILKRIIDTGDFIEGDIIVKEEQCKYADGTYARSYTETKTFVPHIKISLNKDKTIEETKIKTMRIIPEVPKEERTQLQEGTEPRIVLPKVDIKKIKLLNEGTEPKEPKAKHIKLKNN